MIKQGYDNLWIKHPLKVNYLMNSTEVCKGNIQLFRTLNKYY